MGTISMHEVRCCDDWESTDSVMCAEMTKYIVGKMAEFNAPLLFCRCSRESYNVDISQRGEQKKKILNFVSRNKEFAVDYADTSDMMVTFSVSNKQFVEMAEILFNYFSELLISIPKEGFDWNAFMNTFQHGHSSRQIKNIKAMSNVVVLIATDEASVQVIE